MYHFEQLHRAKDSSTFGKESSLHNKNLTFVYKFVYNINNKAVKARSYICIGIKEVISINGGKMCVSGKYQCAKNFILL